MSSVRAQNLPTKNTKKRHDKVALRVHWELCNKHKMEHTDKWYEHVAPAMVETETMTLKWDSTIYTDNKLTHN